MTAILESVKVHVPTADSYVTIETTKGVYVADGDISSATGITVATEEEYNKYPSVPIGYAITDGYLRSILVDVCPEDGSKCYIKKLHYSVDKSSTVEDSLDTGDVTWPVGKAQGFKITGIHTARRITSRQ